jgi:hypothetical protein
MVTRLVEAIKKDLRFMGPLGLHYNGFAVDQTPEASIDQRTKAASENEPMLYCPVCSRRLTERKCKLLCEQCGYYMSCADYY